MNDKTPILTQEQIDALTPIVHLNGDSHTTLFEQWDEFTKALEKARELTPPTHGRNYYPKPNGRGELDAREAIAVLYQALEKVEDAAVAVLLAIDSIES